MHMQEILKSLREDADAACLSAIANKEDIEGAINWADLSCVEARYCENDSGEKYYAVLIEECSPNQNDLYSFISTKLQQAGWDGVEILFEW